MSAPQAKTGWARLLGHSDVMLAVAVVLVVAMMMIPLPAVMLDVLLTVNIAFSITMLLVTLYTNEPLEYSTFPTVLLVATLFRLGLNVSSTRLILLHGNAGQVIEAFGNFVIGGNYVVGLLIFVILIIINFIVITNGAGRVSEVAARFTLDAMPGKQLSIDADLNAGIIDEKQAKKRRTQIQREADFYGTMDGASKFVKGDAIAGIVIVLINVIGGLIVGVAQQQMSLADSAATFTTLTVGDGLVSQVPALLISVATGILVTRVSNPDASLGDDIGAQMFTNPKVLGILGALLLALGVIPGLPNLQFLLIGGAATTVAVFLHRGKQKKEAEVEAQKVIEQKQTKKKSATDVMDLLAVDTLEIEIGYRLIPLIEVESGGDLLERIGQLRRQIAQELGFVVPSVRVRDNLKLAPNTYHINLRGVKIDGGDVYPDRYMAMATDPDVEGSMDGLEAKEPAFGLPALWVEDERKEEAEELGYTVVSASAVVSTHLSEVLKRYSASILTRSDVQQLLDNVKKTHAPLVEDLVPDGLSPAEVHVVLQQLLKEKVCIRDMVSILEALSYHYRVSKNPDYLTEQVRVALSRSICKQHLNMDDELPVITIAPDLEELMAQGLNTDDNILALGPVFTQNFLNGLNQEVENAVSHAGIQPVLLCNARLRLPIRRLIERTLPQIAVMSYNEIGPTTKVMSLGMIRMEANISAA